MREKEERPRSEIFREVFLAILPPEEAEVFTAWGAVVSARFMDRPGFEVPATSFIEAEMKGVLADFRHLAECLRDVARQRETSELSVAEWRLAELADTLAKEVSSLEGCLQRELARVAEGTDS